MFYVRIIDQDGIFVEDAFVEELTEFTIETPCPDGFYHPKWDGEKWVEGLSQTEIDAIKAEVKPQEPTESERLEALESAMLEMILGGAL